MTTLRASVQKRLAEGAKPPGKPYRRSYEQGLQFGRTIERARVLRLIEGLVVNAETRRVLQQLQLLVRGR